MSAADTTIRVPRESRDRVSTRAERDHVTLATVIARALDALEEAEFWADVQRRHAELSDEERHPHMSHRTLVDGLADADDDALTAEDMW